MRRVGRVAFLPPIDRNTEVALRPVQGFDGAIMSFVEYLYELGKYTDDRYAGLRPGSGRGWTGSASRETADRRSADRPVEDRRSVGALQGIWATPMTRGRFSMAVMP